MVGFEPTISVSEWPHAYDLDRAATGTVRCVSCVLLRPDIWLADQLEV